MAEDDDKAEKLLQDLRDARTSWQETGSGLPGQRREEIGRTLEQERTTDFPPGAIVREPRQPAFPTEDAATQIVQQAGGGSINASFILRNASTSDGGAAVKVLDGKLNGEFPSGMGFGDYVLTITNPEDSLIYVGATFNVETLAITTRFLGVSTAADFPESRVDEDGGFLYWLIGFTYMDEDSFKIWQSRIGDINFDFSFGVDNGGRPALIPTESGPGWLDLEQLFP